MKIRNGFVSNSSSASFVIDKTKLRPWQIEAIKDHIHAGQVLKLATMEYADDMDAWEIGIETENTITLSTIIDNFNMDDLLSAIEAHHAIISRED